MLTPQMALTFWYFNGHDMKNWDGSFPISKYWANSLLLSSKMTADVNPYFQMPARLACQELPKANLQTVHSCTARGLLLCARHRNWSPAPLNQVLVRSMGSPDFPSLEGRTPPVWWSFWRVQRKQFRVLVVMQSLLLTHNCLVKGSNKKWALQRACHQRSVRHNVNLWLNVFFYFYFFIKIRPEWTQM